MKESFAVPLLLALLFVGVTLGISSVSIQERNQMAQVTGSTLTTGSIPVTYAVTVSSDLICVGSEARRTVGFFTSPTAGGYFSIYGVGGADMGDREPGLYDLPVGTYTWEGIVRSGYMRAGEYVGSFTVSGTCTATTPPPTTATQTSSQIPPESGVDTSTTPPPAVTPPPSSGSTTTLRPASVTVSVGTECSLERNMTQIAIAAEPRDGATVVIQKENGNIITSTSQGIVYLPNGSYVWKSEARAGYQISGNASGALTLSSCPLRAKPVVVAGSSCDSIEEGTPVRFESEGEGKIYFTVKNISTGDSVPLQTGTEYFPNGNYEWKAVPASGAKVLLDGPTFGSFSVTSCKNTLTTPYVPPKAGTLLFFRDGKLIDPIVRQGEKIAVRVDLSGVSAVELERLGKDTRDVLGAMQKDAGTTRWLFVWNVGTVMPGEYNLIARAKGSKGESVSGSRLVTVLPSAEIVPPPTSFSGIPESNPRAPLPEEFPPLGDVTPPEEPVFERLSMDSDGGIPLSLPVRGVADLISTKDILSAKNTLPDAIRSPEDLRVFCASGTNDDICLDFLPEKLREEARVAVEESRKELSRAFDERPVAVEDTDKDGLSNFDETHFYGTDPAKTDSDGDGKSDGEEILLVTDPLKSGAKTQGILFENPAFGGEEKPETFIVKDVRVLKNENEPSANSDIKVLPITLSGSALPSAIVTLYIYSDPIIVRVKADETGLWSYTLTKELPDGSHKAYVAMTDSAGRVLAKSAPLPFVKQAAAVSVTPADLPSLGDSAPSLFSGTSLYAIIFIIMGVIGFSILAIGVIVRSRKEEGVIP